MDQRKKAGLKAGGLCGIGILVIQFLSIEYMVVTLTSIGGWLFYFLPGVLSVHFGRFVIKNGKDAAVSILVAGFVSSFIWVSVSIFFASLSTSMWWFEDDPLYIGLIILVFFILVLLLTVPLSLISGLVYTKYKLGIPLREQKLIPPKIQPRPIQPLYCFQCGKKVEENWVSCPHCGVRLKEDTRIYDDDTRIY